MQSINKFDTRSKKIFLIAALFFLISASSGCIQDVIHSGENADYDPQNINGYPVTLEKRGMAVPAVVEITPKEKYIGPECKITVIFNEKMDRASVEEKFRIYNSRDYPFYGKFIWGTILNTDKEYFDYIPVKQLISDDYRVVLLEGAKSAGNIEMPERFTSRFTFKPVPLANNELVK
ncbi:MAG TPA: hypothetical protein PKW98_03765 [Candidatus Wallbacteria bacterium]|nr:MAG: hypothetical protein BWY32_00939 [bacterium ADurb.Bin243]HPG56910.1 hypothetical protein [Candidatus Wallbacteria bacterium]